MQFTTNVQLLLDGLNTVTRALSARPTKQILEGVHLSAVGEHVKLTCSDGNLSIEMSILADVKEEGTAVLPGRLFTELSRKLPGGEVTIRVGENHAASIRCLSSKSNLAGMNPTDYPEMARVSEGTTVRIPQDKLKEMILPYCRSQAAACAGAVECKRIKKQKKPSMNLEKSDRRRLFLF